LYQSNIIGFTSTQMREMPISMTFSRVCVYMVISVQAIIPRPKKIWHQTRGTGTLHDMRTTATRTYTHTDTRDSTYANTHEKERAARRRCRGMTHSPWAN